MNLFSWARRNWATRYWSLAAGLGFIRGAWDTLKSYLPNRHLSDDLALLMAPAGFSAAILCQMLARQGRHQTREFFREWPLYILIYVGTFPGYFGFDRLCLHLWEKGVSAAMFATDSGMLAIFAFSLFVSRRFLERSGPHC